MIAKGHDIHGVTLVGVVGADFALGLPDFRAAERVFQLLTQVSGRAGRGELPGKVLVQTYHPDHYAIKFAAKHDYPGFVAKEMQYRRWMHYPPYAVLANVVMQSEKLEEATAWAGALGRWFQASAAGEGAGAGAGGGADRAAEADLSVSLCAEGGAAAGAGRGAAGDAGVCGDAGDSTPEPGGRRGRSAPDVDEETGSGSAEPYVSDAALVEQVQFFAGLEADCLAGGDGDLGSGAWIAADAGLAGLDGEDAEATELDAVACDEGLLHALEDCVDRRLCFGSWQSGALNNPLY